MQMKTCVKCGFTDVKEGDDDPMAACPSCGAIYAKAVPTRSRPALASATTSGFGPSEFPPFRTSAHGGPATPPPGVHSHAQPRQARGAAAPVLPREFVVRMRAETLYPTVRALNRWVMWIMMLVAFGAVVGGFVASSATNPLPALAGIGTGVFIAAMAVVMRELTNMLADLSDATVVSAAHAEAAPR